MAHLRDAIRQLVNEHQPCTVRQVYYLGIGRWWPKDAGHSRKHYGTVCRLPSGSPCGQGMPVTAQAIHAHLLGTTRWAGVRRRRRSPRPAAAMTMWPSSVMSPPQGVELLWRFKRA
jgi:hypothetical protein